MSSLAQSQEILETNEVNMELVIRWKADYSGPCSPVIGQVQFNFMEFELDGTESTAQPSVVALSALSDPTVESREDSRPEDLKHKPLARGNRQYPEH